MKTVIMLSGGLDSVLATWYLPHAHCLHVNFGMKYSAKEFEAVVNMSKRYISNPVSYVSLASAISLDNVGKSSFIPSRNLLLATLGVIYGKADMVCIAGLRDDVVEDKTPMAFVEMSRLLTAQSRRQVTVFSPFWEFSKRELIEDFISKGGSRELLDASISCYNPGAQHCGNCPSCYRKWVAYVGAGLIPPFAIDGEIVSIYAEKLILEPDTYDSTRVQDMHLAHHVFTRFSQNWGDEDVREYKKFFEDWRKYHV